METQGYLGAENQLGIDIWKHKHRYQDEISEQWPEYINGRFRDYEADTGGEGSGGRP